MCRVAEDVEQISERIVAFLAAQPGRPAPRRIEAVQRIGVGRSRENWLFDAVWTTTDGRGDTEPLIVRRDPPGGLLETDRATEFAVLEALVPTAVPAPLPRWLDATGAHLGRPSLIMRRAPGTCDYFVLNGPLPLERRSALAARFCDLLATIHLVDWRGCGLDRTFPDPGPGAAVHELDAWEAVLRRDRLEPTPELDLAARRLRAAAPSTTRTVLVHGDFKPGNALLEERDGSEHIVALLDWELAHLGDPMEDLGWITQPLRTREHLIPGAWEREDLFARYEAATGWAVDLEAVRWWNAFASFKTAVMQTSGLRSFVEGRCDEPYRPTAAVLRTLLDAVGV